MFSVTNHNSYVQNVSSPRCILMC